MISRRLRQRLLILSIAFILFLGTLLYAERYVHFSTSKVMPEKSSVVANQEVRLMLSEINTTLIKALKGFHDNTFHNPAGKAKPSTQGVAKASIYTKKMYDHSVDFKFVFPDISPKIDRKEKIFMIVLVNSGAKGDGTFRKRREVIRQTYGDRNNCELRKTLQNEKLKRLKWLLVFVVGKAGPGTNDDELNMAEAKHYNDMLIGNITYSYFNNIIKFYMGHVWASGFNIEYTFKTDDDVYIRIPRVLEYLVDNKFPKQFNGGWIVAERKVDRDLRQKWGISWEEFGEEAFPAFTAGSFTIFSYDLLNKMFNYIYIRKPFFIDDAYIGLFIS